MHRYHNVRDEAGEQGKVRLNDPVASYLPDFAENSKENITGREVADTLFRYKGRPRSQDATALVFLLGVLTKTASERGAMIGMLCGLVLNLGLWLSTNVPFTWYVAIGSLATFVIGYGASFFQPSKPLALLLLFLSISLIGASGQDVSSAKRLDRMLANFTDSHSPGLAVLVRQNGRMLFQRGYGVKDLKTRTAIDAHTNFRLASCTKQFTAMAVMLMVHDGKLSYDEQLTDVFPDFPAYGKAITIRNLLNHSSGLPDYEELMEQTSSSHHSRWTADHQIQDAEVLTLLEGQNHGKFAPGTTWSYSNSGYVVLGLVVGKVSGVPFEDFLSERIFKPLEMDHTLAFVRGENEVSSRAYGHSKEREALIETDQSSTSATLGDGGVYSNLEDLAKWDNALEHHTLLSEAEMQPALTPFKLPDGSQPHWASDESDANPQPGKSVSYGFGWFLDPYKNHARMWHYGDTIGFKTATERFTRDKLTIIVLCNRSDLDAAALASKVADAYLK